MTQIDKTLNKFTFQIVWGLQTFFLALMTIVYCNDKLHEVNVHCNYMMFFFFQYIDLDAWGRVFLSLYIKCSATLRPSLIFIDP